MVRVGLFCSRLATCGRLLRLSLGQRVGSQRLPRVPEPRAVMTDAEQVEHYDQGPTTKLALLYAWALEVVHRARATVGGRALDLACGPGHFTLGLHRFLGYERVLGIDLSPRMVESARRNAGKAGSAGHVHFQVGDVAQGMDLPTGEFDLASFTMAAHHLPDLESVGRVVGEMDRVTRPEGLVLVMDLVRLRTARLTEGYIATTGREYQEKGLHRLREDFRNSMYAAWTVRELRQGIPRHTRRVWCHVVGGGGVPAVQLILGLPVGRRQVLVRSGFPWEPGRCPVPAEMNWEWNLLRSALLRGSWRCVAEGGANSQPAETLVEAS